MASTSPSPLIWFLLVDSVTGEPYKGTDSDYVSRQPRSVIAQFRDAVKAKHSNKLASVDAADLLVYANKAAFDKRPVPNDPDGVPLKSSHPLDNSFGQSDKEQDMLIVAVPSSRSSTSESSLTGKEPNPKRKKRWIELNEILGENSKQSKTNDSTAYSYVTWNRVKSLFSPIEYVQPQKTIDDEHLDFLEKYLSFTTKCLGSIPSGDEATRLHFIAPILICVCILFKGDVDIVVEEELTGDFVKAHGHFEFMLRRGNKAICIVEAKKEDMDQGMAQDLVGCEVAADVGGLDVVYGIVTNYIQWTFMQSLNDKIQAQACSLRLAPNGPERESLKEITEKIYAMLSDE